MQSNALNPAAAKPAPKETPKAKPVAEPPASPERRSFITRFLAATIGLVVGTVPLLSGLAVYFDPLRRKKETGGKPLRVALLEAIPPDGVPYRFPVIDIREDAWSKYPPEPIDAVFLRRTSDAKLQAWSSVCPHLGCSVDFKPEEAKYKCPCHNSSWTSDAERINPELCPSPRDLDELEVEIRNENEVWIKYKRFRSGTEAKIEE